MAEKGIQPGSIWKVEYFQRTRWAKATVKVKDYRPGFGWLLITKRGLGSQICRERVKFIKELQSEDDEM